MTKWEYKIEWPYNFEEKLNALGAKGWELVGFDDGLAYFKRPLGTYGKMDSAVWTVAEEPDEAMGSTSATPWPVHGYG